MEETPLFQAYMIFALNCTYKLLGYDFRKDILSPDIQKLLDKVLKDQG